MIKIKEVGIGPLPHFWDSPTVLQICVYSCYCTTNWFAVLFAWVWLHLTQDSLSSCGTEHLITLDMARNCGIVCTIGNNSSSSTFPGMTMTNRDGTTAVSHKFLQSRARYVYTCKHEWNTTLLCITLHYTLCVITYRLWGNGATCPPPVGGNWTPVVGNRFGLLMSH